MTTKLERQGRKNKRFIDHAIKKIRPTKPTKSSSKSKETKFIGV